MIRLFRKTIAVCLIGFGIGILLVILLPFTGWLFFLSLTIIAVGISWLLC